MVPNQKINDNMKQIIEDIRNDANTNNTVYENKEEKKEDIMDEHTRDMLASLRRENDDFKSEMRDRDARSESNCHGGKNRFVFKRT